MMTFDSDLKSLLMMVGLVMVLVLGMIWGWNYHTERKARFMEACRAELLSEFECIYRWDLLMAQERAASRPVTITD